MTHTKTNKITFVTEKQVEAYKLLKEYTIEYSEAKRAFENGRLAEDYAWGTRAKRLRDIERLIIALGVILQVEGDY